MALEEIGYQATFKGASQYISQLNQAERAEAALAKQTVATAASTGSLEKAAAKGGSSLLSFGNAAKLVAGVGLVGMVTGIAKVGIGFDSLYQGSKIAFETLLGSGEKAEAFLKDLADFAAKTPFEFPDLLQTSRNLVAMGFAAEEVIPMMTSIGDAVAAMGGSPEILDRVTRALTQIQAKGKVSAEEFLQLAEAGIPAWKYLAEFLGTSIPDAMEQSRKGMVDSATGIQAILTGMTNQFGGMMEVQSHTFSGVVSTVKDEFTMAAGQVMQPIFERMTTGMQHLADIMASEGFQNGIQGVAEGMASIVDNGIAAADATVGFFNAFHGMDAVHILVQELPILAISLGAVIAAMAIQRVIAFGKEIYELGRMIHQFGGIIDANTGQMITLGSALKSPAAAVGGLTLAFSALDIGLRAFTGKGLLETVIDLFHRTDYEANAAADAIDHFNRVNLGLSDTSAFANTMSDATLKIQEFNQMIGETADGGFAYVDVLASMRDGTAELGYHTSQEKQAVDDLSKSQKELAGYLEGALQDMKDHGATADELVGVYNQWKDILGDTGVEVLGLVGKSKVYKDAETEVNNVLKEQQRLRDIQVLKNYSFALDALNGSTLATVDANKKAEVSVEDFTASMEKNLGHIPTIADTVKEYFVNEWAPSFKDGADDAGKAFDQLTKDSQKSFDGMIDSLGDLLPAVDETFDEWKKRLEELAEAHVNFQSNLQTVYDELVSSGVAMPERIIEALAEKGPLVTEHVKQLFVDDPAAAMEIIKTLFPEIYGTSVDNIITNVTGMGPLIREAIRDGLITPTESELQTLADLGETYGTDMIDGWVLGLTAGGASVSEAMTTIINDMFFAGASELEAHSPSVRAARELGLPTVLGIAQGIKDGYPELKLSVQELADMLVNWDAYGYTSEDFYALGGTITDAIALGIEDGTPTVIGAMGEMIGALRIEAGDSLTTAAETFVNAVDISNYKRGLIEKYGDTGGELAAALADALADGTARAGSSLARALDKAISDMERAGVPNATALGNELASAMAAALASGSPETVAAVIDIIASMNGAIEQAKASGDDPGATLGDAFKDGWESKDGEIQALTTTSVKDFMSGLADAIESNDAEAINQMGETAKNIGEAFAYGLDPDQADTLLGAFFDAINEAIDTGTAESLAKVAAAVKAIQDAGSGVGSGGTADTGGGTAGNPYVPEQPGRVSTWQPTGEINFSTGQTRVARQDPSGAIYYQTTDGRWIRYGAADSTDPNTGEITPGGAASRAGYHSFDRGTNYLPYDILALLHRGEAVVPASLNPFNPNAARPMAAAAGGGTTYNLTADFRGATLSGDVEDNADMVKKAFKELIEEELGHDAVLHGAAVLR